MSIEAVLDDVDAVPLGLVDPLVCLRAYMGLFSRDGEIRDAPAVHEVVDRGLPG